MGVHVYNPGEVIIEEGSYGTSAFAIDSGKVEISGMVNGKKTVFASLGKKQIFGEMGLIEDKPRSATVTAVEETSVREITRDGFNELFEKNPKVLLPIVKALFERLRTATRMAAAKIAAASQPEAAKKDQKPEEKIIDERYIIMSGATEFAKQALEFSELEVKEFPFRVGRYTLGQSKATDVLSDNDFYIKEDSPPYYVSRNHFLIDKIDGEICIVDRGSRLGILIDNKKIDESYALKKETTEIIVGSAFSPFSFDITIKGDIKKATSDILTNAPDKPVQKNYEKVG